jgi:hypothetical protein
MEYSVERDDIHTFNDHVDSLLTNIDRSAAGEGLQQDLDELIEFLVEHGNCVVNEGTSDMNWDLWGSMFFLLSVATSIGYGSFSVTQGRTQGLTVALSVVLLPLFIVCLKYTTDLLLPLVKFLPGYPKSRSMESMMSLSLRRASFAAVFLFLCLGAWIVVIGAVSLTAIMDEERTLGEGVYFGWVTLSTIGFGDFVFDIKEGKGAGILFILVGLPLFSTFIDALVSYVGLASHKASVAWRASFGAGGAGVPLDELRCERLERASRLYTDDELTLAAAAFSVVDTFNRNDDGTLDAAELKNMLYMVGASDTAGFGDGGGALGGDPVDEGALIDCLLATADPLGVGSGGCVVGSGADADGTKVSAGLDPGAWLLVLAPMFTGAGHRREVNRGIAGCVLSWVVVGCFIALGGWLLQMVEGDAEDDRLEIWDRVLKVHSSHLDEEKEVSGSSMRDLLPLINIDESSFFLGPPEFHDRSSRWQRCLRHP